MVFEEITKYAEVLDGSCAGEWVVDTTSTGAPEDPIHMPYVDYSEAALGFEAAFYRSFTDYDYIETCKTCGVDSMSFEDIDLSKLDASCVLALITRFIRGDRFCEGLLKGALEDGSITNLLLRLKEIDESPKEATLKDAVYGLAVGDALGVPGEFQDRGSYRIESMVGGGIHRQPCGTWSDDTSMTLAMCASIKDQAKVDIEDIRKRFCAWLFEGEYTVDGKAFDCGNTVSEALSTGNGCTGEKSNGNGSLMRIIPLAFLETDSKTVEEVSAITYAHKISKLACVYYIAYAKRLLVGCSPKQSLRVFTKIDPPFDRLDQIDKLEENDVKSTGYVVDTLEAALWCLTTTDTYKDCLIKAVNLGNDTDTVAAVAGALAGIYYGYDAIPQDWLSALRGKDVIDACLF